MAGVAAIITKLDCVLESSFQNDRSCTRRIVNIIIRLAKKTNALKNSEL
jgi:hypothetical protein